jgi:hypothetical protein
VTRACCKSIYSHITYEWVGGPAPQVGACHRLGDIVNAILKRLHRSVVPDWIFWITKVGVGDEDLGVTKLVQKLEFSPDRRNALL